LKKFSLFVVFAIIAILVSPGQFAFATPFSTNVATDVYAVAQGGVVNGIPTARDNNDGLPDIHDAVEFLHAIALLPNTFPRNKDVDPLFKEPDELWQEMGNGEVALIGLTAGNSNTIGVYTDLGTGNVRTVVLGPNSGFGFTGDGTMANPFPAGMTGLVPNQNFGWYLQSNQNFFFSESTLNEPLPTGAGIDHMMTFDLSALAGTQIFVDLGAGPVPLILGTSTFLIAWEDLLFNGNTAGDDDYDDMMYLVTNVDEIPLVGGEIIPIESTSLILAGAQSFSWMIPVLLSGIGIGLFVLRKK